MLSITIEATELFNELTGEFVTLKPVTLKLEHSLISISKWEAKWHKPFSNSEKTAEEMRDSVMSGSIWLETHGSSAIREQRHLVY